MHAARWGANESAAAHRTACPKYPAFGSCRRKSRVSQPGLRPCGRDKTQRCASGGAVYGVVYGMEKTTVYVPPEVKRALARLASARGTSEAELIREALRRIVAEAPAPRPRLPLIESGQPTLAERLDEALKGFGSA